MNAQEIEIEKLRGEIGAEVRGIFKANMKIFDWNIPENDDRRSADMILAVMREALDQLKNEVDEGKFDTY